MRSSRPRRPRSSAEHDVGAGAYAALAADYHWLYDDAQLRRGTTTPGVRAALSGPAPGRRVLDAACGIGLDLVALARRGHDVTGVDASPAMAAEARRRLADAGVDAPVHVGRWEALDEVVPAGAFDVVLCAGSSIAHAPDGDARRAALAAFRRACRPGGLVVVDTHGWAVVEGLGDRVVVDPVVVAREGRRCTRRYSWQLGPPGRGPHRLVIDLVLDDGVEPATRTHAVVLHPFARDELLAEARSAGLGVLVMDGRGDDDRYTLVARPRDGGGDGPSR